MTLLNAWALWFAALSPVIVLLYLLKLKRRPLSVSTLMFWQRVLQENRRRAFFQKLRQILSLLLHLLIFALIFAALLKPVWDRVVRDGASTVLIIDTRARMRAIEDGGTRFERARRLAAGYIGAVNARRQLAILSADAAPRVVAPFTDDEIALRRSLETLTATDAAGDLAPAVELAASLLAARQGERQIVVLTDRAPGAGDISKSKINVHYVPTGSAHDNVAITRFAARPMLNSPQTSEVLIELRNFGRASARGNVELLLDGRRLDVQPYDLAPGARKLRVLPVVPRAGAVSRGWLIARLDSTDALTSDNTAFAVLPTPPARRVLLVSTGNFFLEKLLSADSGVKFEMLGPDSFQPELAAKFDAVIFDHDLPAGLDFKRVAGNFLFIRQTPFDDPSAIVEQPLITDLDEDHATLRLVNLRNVAVVRAAAMARPPDADGWHWHAPIRSFDRPLLLTGENGARRVAALAFDVAESDLPLRVAFPLLMQNTIQWLSGDVGAVAQSCMAGESIALADGESAWTVAQTEFAHELEPDPRQFVHGVFQPLTNGFHLLRQPTGARWIAVNTFSESESDLHRDPDAAFAAGKNALPSRAPRAVWAPWIYFAIVAFALLLAEWWLFHRRRTE